MNEIIFYKVDRDNLCETDYFDAIARHLNETLFDFSIVFTADWETLPKTKFKKIVILGGDERFNAGIQPYFQYSDVVAVFRIYNEDGWYGNKYVFPIPPGYNCRSEGQKMTRFYPEKKLSERKWDIFYSGQVLNNRKELVKQLIPLAKEFNVYSQTNPSFRTGLPIDEYYQMLGDSKICVCPDGTAVDTFRFVEACASGCIVITTPKSDLWYYEDAPIQVVEDWTELTYWLIEELFHGKPLSMIKSEVLGYYEYSLSPKAVATYITKTVCSIS